MLHAYVFLIKLGAGFDPSMTFDEISVDCSGRDEIQTHKLLIMILDKSSNKNIGKIFQNAIPKCVNSMWQFDFVFSLHFDIVMIIGNQK